MESITSIQYTDIISFTNTDTQSQTATINTLTITNIPLTAISDLTPKLISSIATKVQNSGDIVFQFDSTELPETEYKKILQNIKFAGWLSIAKKGTNEVTCKNKKWNSGDNSTKWAKINPKTTEETKGVDASNLIDPFDSTQKKIPCSWRAKPCANCTCGRAKQLMQEGKMELKDFKSNCGRCHLGDDFRCANCPYRGMPAFKEGEKIEINNNGTNVGVAEASESVKTKVEGNSAVKLDL